MVGDAIAVRVDRLAVEHAVAVGVLVLLVQDACNRAMNVVVSKYCCKQLARLSGGRGR